MRNLLLLVVFLLGINSNAIAEDCQVSESPLVELLDQYSKAYDAKFIIDPRVRQKVTLIGIQTDSINSSMLIGILNIHGYTAKTKDGVIYVLPSPVAEVSGDRFGVTWEG